MQHFVNMSNSGITVYNPVNGEIQADIYLPIPLQSLDVLPVFNITKYSNRINGYLPGSFDISSYIPGSDYKNWLPPFKGNSRQLFIHLCTYTFQLHLRSDKKQ